MDLATYETLHQSRKTIDQIAMETGIKKSTLYRYALPMASSGLDIPMRHITPIMRASGKYRILHLLAADCRFLCVRDPGSPRKRSDENALIAALQKAAADAAVQTMQFFEKPTVAAMRTAEDALNNSARVALGLKKLMQRRGQLELFDLNTGV